jgi:hypothetical protein
MTAGHIWANEDPDVKVGQFPESDLANFHNTIKVLVQTATMTMALPPHFNPFTGENPSSADAIRSSETQLVKRVERKQTFLGGAWEEVMRLVLRFQTGVFEDRARSLETMWRDPSTPTVAQKADAVMKLATPINGGRAILPIEQAREDLGYTPEQRRRMADMDDAAAVDQNVATIARTFQAGATPARDQCPRRRQLRRCTRRSSGINCCWCSVAAGCGRRCRRRTSTVVVGHRTVARGADCGRSTGCGYGWRGVRAEALSQQGIPTSPRGPRAALSVRRGGVGWPDARRAPRGRCGQREARGDPRAWTAATRWRTVSGGLRRRCVAP